MRRELANEAVTKRDDALQYTRGYVAQTGGEHVERSFGVSARGRRRRRRRVTKYSLDQKEREREKRERERERTHTVSLPFSTTDGTRMEGRESGDDTTRLQPAARAYVRPSSQLDAADGAD